MTDKIRPAVPLTSASPVEFYEDDQPVEEVRRQFDAGERFVTAAPPPTGVRSPTMPTDPTDVELVARALRAQPICRHISVTSISQSGRCDECTVAVVLSALAAAGRLLPPDAEAVLIAHQRHRGGCLCGWNELGKSHPGHQVVMLREATSARISGESNHADTEETP